MMHRDTFRKGQRGDRVMGLQQTSAVHTIVHVQQVPQVNSKLQMAPTGNGILQSSQSLQGQQQQQKPAANRFRVTFCHAGLSAQVRARHIRAEGGFGGENSTVGAAAARLPRGTETPGWHGHSSTEELPCHPRRQPLHEQGEKFTVAVHGPCHPRLLPQEGSEAPRSNAKKVAAVSSALPAISSSSKHDD